MVPSWNYIVLTWNYIVPTWNYMVPFEVTSTDEGQTNLRLISFEALVSSVRLGVTLPLFILLSAAAGRVISYGRGRLDQRDHPGRCHRPGLHPPALLPDRGAAPGVRVRVPGAGEL